MAKMYIKDTFQYRSKIYRSNEEGNLIIKVTAEELKAEMAKGKCTKVVKDKPAEKWVSGLLNHCEPADKEAKEIILGESFDEEAEKKAKADADALAAEQAKADAEEKAAIHKELDEMGKAYDKRTGLTKLRDIIKRARIEAGV